MRKVKLTQFVAATVLLSLSSPVRGQYGSQIIPKKQLVEYSLDVVSLTALIKHWNIEREQRYEIARDGIQKIAKNGIRLEIERHSLRQVAKSLERAALYIAGAIVLGGLIVGSALKRPSARMKDSA